MAGKRGRPPKQKRPDKEFANLYVNGPDGLRGNWEAVEEALGRKFTVAEVRDAIVGEGGALPNTMPSTLPTATIEEFASLDFEKISTDMANATTQDDWKKIAKEIGATALKIMTGEAKGSAAQTSLIKTIWDRAYGKISAKDEEKGVEAGIIILPTLGERSNMKLCPRCRYEMETKYPKEVFTDAEEGLQKD